MVLSAINAVYRQNFGLTGLQIDGAMDVQVLPPGGLFHRNRDARRRPAADRLGAVNRVHGIAEHDHLVVQQAIQQRLVFRNEAALPGGIHFAGNRLWPAVLKAQTMQQLNQAGTAGVADATICLDPGTHLARGARQGLRDPLLQFRFLSRRQKCLTACVVEARKSIDALCFKQLAPAAHRLVVQQQHHADLAIVHSPIQQYQRVGAARQPVFGQPIAGKFLKNPQFVRL